MYWLYYLSGVYSVLLVESLGMPCQHLASYRFAAASSCPLLMLPWVDMAMA